MIPIIIIVLIVLIGIYGIATYNGLISSRNDVEEGWSTVDVYLKKRHDLIPNLVNTVKGYAEHEKTTLESVMKARNSAISAQTVEERAKQESSLSGALGRLFALSESYPDLKANQNFLDLQNQLKELEEDIANSRKYYNACVKQFNNKVMKFPSSLIAGMFHFEKESMFVLDSPEERENVTVQF